MGRRYGGLKQVQPVGPHGELIIEYSIHDAIRAGFGRLVLVIRKDIEADFRATIGQRLESRLDVNYVYQETGAGRTKPWGTAHAVLVARDAVRGPFAVINADDFYGAAGYAALAAHFTAAQGYALVGYPLQQTLSEFGTVSRGLCATDAQGHLRNITEISKIAKHGTGAQYTDASGAVHALTGGETVSMNFWGFTPEIFPQLEQLFADFLAKNAGDPKAEFYLPTAISTLIDHKDTAVALLKSSDTWFGITYKQDLASSQAALRSLIAAGRYPAPLWG